MTQPRLPGALGRLQDAISRPADQPAMHLPKTVAGGMGTVPAATIDTSKGVPEPRRLSPAQAQHLMMAELADAVRSLVESSTELASRIGRRGSINGVIEVWAGQIPASGLLTRTYEVALGSLVIYSLSAATTFTAQSGQLAGDTGVQAGGVGMQYILPGTRLIMPVGDHSFAIAGPAGDRLCFQAFSGLQPFGVQL